MQPMHLDLLPRSTSSRSCFTRPQSCCTSRPAAAGSLTAMHVVGCWHNPPITDKLAKAKHLIRQQGSL